MTDATESKMLANFQKAESFFKRAKKYSSDFNFKMRLHFRIHLALDELNWMKSEWRDRKVREAKAKGLTNYQVSSALEKTNEREEDDEAATQIEGMDLNKIASMRAELEKEEKAKAEAAAKNANS